MDDFRITKQEQDKVDVQNHPDVVRFVRLSNGMWLRQDNDIFQHKDLFNEELLFHLRAVAPWDEEIDYVDFHMKKESE